MSIYFKKVTFKKIELFASSNRINTQKISLDFKQLINARNDVAHDGKMSMEIRNNKDSSPYKLLIAGQFGLETRGQPPCFKEV